MDCSRGAGTGGAEGAAAPLVFFCGQTVVNKKNWAKFVIIKIHLNISMVAPMFITFSLHWLFCYLFLCDLRHIYHLPIHLTVVRIKVIKVIKLMQGYLMRALRTSCQITHAALPMLAFMFVNVMFVLWDL